MNHSRIQNLEQLSKLLSKNLIQQSSKVKGGAVVEDEIGGM